MNYFDYRGGRLHAEGVPLATIAAEVGTPAYVYSAATLRRHYKVFAGALASAAPGVKHLICYSLKANSNQAVIRVLADLGSGADVVSLGELRRALAAGIPGGKIVFSGVGKTAPEMRAALEAGIRQFNVESEPELEVLAAVADSMGLRAPVAFRVNPDVDAETHAKISTGKKENKFGVPFDRAREIYRWAATHPSIEIVGVDVHIGSQLTNLTPFERAFAKVADLVHALRDDGHAIRSVDLGGGLGIPYERNAPWPHPDAYAGVVQRTVGNLGCELIFEPGRMIAGNSGVLMTSVIYVKQGQDRKFVILDAAMNDLIRPAMYDARHEVMAEREPAPDSAFEKVDLVGPVCESGDMFARDCEVPPLAAGDIVCFETAGAYGAVMSSTYNTRPLVAEVMVDGDRFAVVRPREDLESLIARDQIPEWLRGGAARGGSAKGA
ncbi:MAG: diaminopimelate decarboxylase [Rhizobiales bacterium NRL2]|jgi:diaminopimelate decarboxylase|nr:MAG: diaminopimelate decarboxylase [Rhizobiales bacterium NRL2]